MPYGDCEASVEPGGLLHELAAATGKLLCFYCAFGERSAMAVEAAHDAGLDSSVHLSGGMGEWKSMGGAVEREE